jgi:hypothetical protein
MDENEIITESIIIQAENLSEKYTLACIMLRDMLESSEIDDSIKLATPSDIDQFFTDMINNGESFVSHVEKFEVESGSTEIH